MLPEDIKAWRKGERERLIAARLAVPADERQHHAGAIAHAISAHVGSFADKTISFCWPFRGEPDFRPWMAELTEQGARVALPVVVKLGLPLLFRAYKPGDQLEKGVWNIPFPAEGAEVIPDIVVSPVVGFDPGNYRLGYGGGFFDRTLAGLPRKAFAIGVGYELQRLDTIRPQSWDVPMDIVVTEAGVR